MKPYAWIVLAMTTAACSGGDSPTSPSPSPVPPSVPLCQQQNTAELAMENRSANNATYTIALDGATMGAISPGDYRVATVAAGVSHSIVWLYANTTRIACTAQPIPIQCSSTLYFCNL